MRHIWHDDCFHQYHYIQSHLSGLVLDIPGGSRDNGVQVITYPRKENSLPSDNQLWQFEYQPDGTFLIISKLHGKALDCGGQEKGTHLVMWDRHGRESQRWRTDGNYLVSMSGLVADVEEGRETPGTPVILWTRKKSHLENQLFDIIDVWSMSNYQVWTFCSRHADVHISVWLLQKEAENVRMPVLCTMLVSQRTFSAYSV